MSQCHKKLKCLISSISQTRPDAFHPQNILYFLLQTLVQVVNNFKGTKIAFIFPTNNCFLLISARLASSDWSQTLPTGAQWTRGESHELNYRKFPLNRRELWFGFYWRGKTHSNTSNMPEQVVQSCWGVFILGDNKLQLNTALSNPLWLLLCWAGGWIRQPLEVLSSLNQPQYVGFCHRVIKEAPRRCNHLRGDTPAPSNHHELQHHQPWGTWESHPALCCFEAPVCGIFALEYFK